MAFGQVLGLVLDGLLAFWYFLGRKKVFKIEV
jgi:hypothetical protein